MTSLEINITEWGEVQKHPFSLPFLVPASVPATLTQGF